MKAEPGFLCGLEFDSLSTELLFFVGHGLHIEEAEIDIHAAARRTVAVRQPGPRTRPTRNAPTGELRQRVYGHRLQPADQSKLRDHVLTAFKARAQLSGDAGAVRCDIHVRISS